MSKRQVENDDAPAWAVLIAGIFGGIFLSVVWCAWTAHFDRLDMMESGISDAATQIRELQNFAIAEKKEDRMAKYGCKAFIDMLIKNSESGWDSMSFSDMQVEGPCK